MSGIVGSRHNIRGSGLVGSLGTDGQVFTSAGAGTGAVFEDAAGGGLVLQVLQAVKTDTFSTTASSFADVTDITVDITPASSSNKVLITAFLVCGSASEAHLHFKLLRDSTDILVGDAASSRIQASISLGPIRNTSQAENFSITYLDSPSSTSSVTYKIQMQNQGAGITSYVNRSSVDVDNSTFSRNTSTITVMEISG